VKIVITGSSGHLGEALACRFSELGHEVVGVDLLPSPRTRVVGSILDRALMDELTRGADFVLHTATLHKPHVGSHRKAQFIDVEVLKRYHPGYERIFAGRNWRMFPAIGRVYSNERARERLGWRPKYDFGAVLGRIEGGGNVLSDLALQIGAKGYHRREG
jgi:nucleoside-diphosphate-sugar epimerase